MGVTRGEYAKQAASIIMAVCGLSHVYDTRVGNDLVRGVSGGERKRVSIAEMLLAGSLLCAWDNSTRGLDSATALKFVQSLRMASDLAGCANAVAIYQASEAIYDLFDKAVVLYEGRQVYFGSAASARSYFERMGWECPRRQTTSDFLTSITDHRERRARPGMENRVPRSSLEFEGYWRASPEFAALRREIERHEAAFSDSHRGPALARLQKAKNERQAKHVRAKSPYMISIATQIRLTTKRAYQRMWNDVSATATLAATNLLLALIVGSMFYGTPDSTSGFYAKGSILFLAVLMNVLATFSEIAGLYDQRPVVEKHASYAFYHAGAEAVASFVADIPVKLVAATTFNTAFYFLSGLRRQPGPFFLYFLVMLLTVLVLSAVFRTVAAATKTVAQAMVLAGILMLIFVIYTGFVVPVPQMQSWLAWIRW